MNYQPEDIGLPLKFGMALHSAHEGGVLLVGSIRYLRLPLETSALPKYLSVFGEKLTVSAIHFFLCHVSKQTEQWGGRGDGGGGVGGGGG